MFYISFFEASEELDDKTCREVYRAICRYAFFGEEPDGLSLAASIFFKMAKPNIDNAIRLRENGAAGGRPKKPKVMKSETNGYENKNQRLSDEKPMVTDAETNPIYDVDVDVDKDVDADVDVDVDVELPPAATTDNTLAHALRPSDTTIIKAFDAQDYGLEFGELKRFKELNDSLGWKKPLEVAVERWIANAKKEKPSKPASKPKNKFTDIEQHDYDHDTIEGVLLRKQMDLPPMEGRNDA